MPADAAEIVRLAERVGQATGPNRKLARNVLLACGWRKYARNEYERPDGMIVNVAHLPDPTASLDAAMALVPERAITSIATQQRWKKPEWTWGINDERGITHFAHAATPALALTAACLRARAQQDHEVG